MTSAPYTVADYLLDRLAELGVDRIFGVPGDYTLQLLDHVVAHAAVAWTGCANELNAGYAADGYARMRGIGALCTTFGVGELSAINALAGSYAEFVPVVHIVGAPATRAQAAQRMVHHSLGDGVFTHFLQMHAPITCAAAALTAANAIAEIDRVLSTVRERRLPGYLLLPADVAELDAPPPASRPAPPPPADHDDATAAFTDAARRLLADVAAEDVRFLAGLLVHRLGAVAAMNDLLAAGPVRSASTLWAKSVLDESSPNYLGIYAGAASRPEVRVAIEDAPVLIVGGVQFTDLNSGFFSQQLPRERTIELGAETASVGTATFAPVKLGDALSRLADLVSSLPRTPTAPVASDPATAAESHPAADGPLHQTDLWSALAASLATGDIVLADQGTSFYGMATSRLPRGVTFIGQPLWASIGYTLPAALGAGLAAPGRRVVLLIGDGAAQMTVQECSTLFASGLPVLVVLVDNRGYTVERAIHGSDQPYNDIATWNWTLLPALVAPDRSIRTRAVTTLSDLRAVLDLAAQEPDGATFVQAVVPANDVPPLLTTLALAAAAANRPPLTEPSPE